LTSDNRFGSDLHWFFSRRAQSITNSVKREEIVCVCSNRTGAKDTHKPAGKAGIRHYYKDLARACACASPNGGASDQTEVAIMEIAKALAL
jgi:hypothetical protein